MNIKPVMNPKSVTWGSLSLNGVKAISMRQRGNVLRESADGDRFESVVALAKIGTELLLEGDNIAQQVGSTQIGSEAELRFTLDGARAGDEPITFSAPVAVLVEKRLEAKHGDLASSGLRFVLRSPDGVTAPISVS